MSSRRQPVLSETNSPFTAGQAEALTRLLGEMSPSQCTWLCGYLAALSAVPAANQSGPDEAALANPDVVARVAVFFATETGNSRQLAGRLKDRIEAQGLRAVVHNAAEIRPRKLEEERIALFIASTHGEGDPPEPARPFMAALSGRHAPRLDKLRYSVLALGDSSYRRFCQAGKDLDSRLEALGARRLHPRQDCDVDFAAAAEAWMAGVLHELAQAQDGRRPAEAQALRSPSPDRAPAGLPPSYSRENPYHAEVLTNLVLTDEGSTKATRHLELLIEGAGLAYQPGDALGIYPINPDAETREVIAALGLDPEARVAPGPGKEKALREVLTADRELGRLTPPMVAKYAPFAGDGVAALVEPAQEARLWAYLEGRGLRDLVRDFPPARPVSGQDLVDLLRPMPPRLYSIASSLKAHPGEVHLTVAPARYGGPDGERLGVFSRQCFELVAPGGTLPVFVQANPAFRLPEDAAVPVLMVGPGTGVAPFRAFLQEREESGASGPTWLFFGERNFRSDFLYQAEWLRWLKEGVLTRMDVAFSRDTSRRVYVQDRLRERARDVCEWLEQGAHLFVCGDAKRMAPGVHQVLVQAVQDQGGKTREAAAAYLDELKEQGRYHLDVY